MTKLVGILNLTPDSFSDGGQHDTLDSQIAALHQLIADGADMVDIGAESTRPGATPLSPAEEWERLAPFIEAEKPAIPLSLDTYHPENAVRALAHGFSAINDVSGFSARGMIDVVKASRCAMIFMHSLTVPADKNTVLPDEIDIVEHLLEYAASHIRRLVEEGIDRARLIFDPGLGFGKTAAQSHAIVNRVAEFKPLNVPLYIGHSRKSFLGEGNRDAATLECSRQLIAAGVDYLRVHDVAAHRRLQ